MAARTPEVHHVHASVPGRVLVRRPAASPRGVLVGFHGYAENADIQLARMETIGGIDDWLVISVQGLNRFYRGRSRDTVAGWMTREDRELVIAANIGYIDRVLDSTMRRMRAQWDSPVEQPVPLVYLGFSQGVAMAFRAAVLGSGKTDGIVAGGGDVPPELLAEARVTFPSALLIRGSGDEWYTAEKLEADATALSARGGAVTAVTIDAGHEWTAEASSASAAFLETLGRLHSPADL